MGWICKIDEIAPGIYLAKNCDTGEDGIQIDAPGMQTGNCSNPEAGGCVLDTSVEIEEGDGPFILVTDQGNVRNATMRPNPEG